MGAGFGVVDGPASGLAQSSAIGVSVGADDDSEVDGFSVGWIPGPGAGFQLDEVLQLRDRHGDRGLRHVVVGLSGKVFGLFSEVQGRGEASNRAELMIGLGDQAASRLAHDASLNADRQKLSGA